MTTALPFSILSIYVTSGGYAFMYFDTKGQPVDWRVRMIRGDLSARNELVSTEIEKILERFCPDAVILEDTAVKGSRRSMRIRRLYRSIAHIAVSKAIDVHRLSHLQVKQAFSGTGAKTRYEIAQAVARELSELSFRLPKKRKLWQTEPAVMALFSAAALGVTFNQQMKWLNSIGLSE